jgi:ribose transport system substrate-binding protein
MKFLIKFFALASILFSFSVFADGHAKTIMLSTKGPGAGNPFWASVEQGAKDAAAELGVNLVILSPPQESDVMAQVAQIEDQIAKGVDGIAIAPTDPNAVAPILDDAMAAGVPVVYIDTNGINDGVTFIGTNNINGAALAAQYICDNIPSGSDVAILQGMITQTTGQHRAEGSNKGLTACGMNIVAELPANWDTAKGMSVMEDIITGNPNIKAVFASNDNMGLGAIEALKNADMLDDVIVVGFDANPDAAASVAAGEMSATIAQFSYNMGYMGVENALKLANGETIPDNIDTGTVLVTKENAADFM